MALEDDKIILSRLRAGDRAAFDALVVRFHGRLLRLARLFVTTEASAQDAVQEAWLAVLDRLDTFEGRSSLLTWISRIVVNRAKTRGGRESRTLPFSALGDHLAEADGATEAFDRFDENGHWSAPPARWDDDTPERLLGNREAMAIVEQELRQLPEKQRIILLLRDTLGWTADEVCNALQLHETNQRVLLHRARRRLRARIELHFQKP